MKSRWETAAGVETCGGRWYRGKEERDPLASASTCTLLFPKRAVPVRTTTRVSSPQSSWRLPSRLAAVGSSRRVHRPLLTLLRRARSRSLLRCSTQVRRCVRLERLVVAERVVAVHERVGLRGGRDGRAECVERRRGDG